MRLFAIGDIQGCAAAFDLLLRKIAFRPARDRLWLVGDLVNRGPDSLGVVRRVMRLGRSVTCVLGNHDLHLLATVAGRRQLSPADTFHDVLEAPDVDAIVEWLRRRPLLHYDHEAKRVLVHAGIPPAWTVAEAHSEAHEVERQLRGRQWRSALKEMYGDGPSAWSPKLRGAEPALAGDHEPRSAKGLKFVSTSYTSAPSRRLRPVTTAYVSGVAATSQSVFSTQIVRICSARSMPVPANAIAEKIAESSPWPTTVDEIVLDQSQRPRVATLRRAST